MTTTTTILPPVVFHVPKSYGTGHHKPTDEKTQDPHVFMPCLVVQRHTSLHNGPSQQVVLILNSHTSASRAAGRIRGKHAARIAWRRIHITEKRYGPECIDGVLGGVHPI